MGRLYENLSWTDQDCLNEASDWEVGVHSISSSRIVLFCFFKEKKREEKNHPSRLAAFGVQVAPLLKSRVLNTTYC